MPTDTQLTIAAEGSSAPPATFSDADLPNFDFLRAVAVLLVLFGHLTYFLGLTRLGPLNLIYAGSMGVKIFFVHTCFVLMLSLERQWKNQGAVTFFTSFVIRRIFRIYPLSICAISSVTLFRLPLAQLNPGEFVGLPLHPSLIISNLLLIQRTVNSILGPTWSLPYEMGMYLLLPWIFFLIYPSKSLWRVAAIWLLSLAAAAVLLFRMGGGSNFLLYVPCFIPGVIAYQLQRSQQRQILALVWPGFVIGAVLLYLWNQNYLSDSSIKGWIVCLALGASAPFFTQISSPWLTGSSLFIARYSYGIYLTHFFSIWLMFDRLHYVLPRSARLLMFGVLVVLLPLAFYHLLEEPLIQVGKRIAKRFEGEQMPCQI